MNTRVEQFVAALRSGQYKKTKVKLRIDDTFCALGVACEVYRQATGRGKWEEGFYMSGEDNRIRPFRCNSGLLGESRLPFDVQAYFGFHTDQGLFGFYTHKDFTVARINGYLSMSELNDLTPLTFEQIADIVEDNYGQIFHE
jgi:hypothetical protein